MSSIFQHSINSPNDTIESRGSSESDDWADDFKPNNK